MTSDAEIYAPRSRNLEFGGPLGALWISISSPFTVYWLLYACSGSECPPHDFLQWHLDGLRNLSFLDGFFSFKALGMYLVWYAWTVLCWAVLPGNKVKGLPLRDGTVLEYKINAFASFVATTVAGGAIVAAFGIDPLIVVADELVPLATSALLVSTVLAFVSYGLSFRSKEMLAAGGNSTSSLYNWFIGRTLNPTIFGLELKYFNELRPGLILWAVIDVCLIAKQYAHIGSVTIAILLSALFHIIYIVDALFNEPNIFTTMDITTDGFGFMLSMGDLLIVPFSYSYHVYVAAQKPVAIPAWGIGLTILLQAVGFYIFRASNNEKNTFRNGGNPKNLASIDTARGTKLLVSGWWGASQHPNYLGDWIMSWGWTVPALFSSPLAAFYPLFFAGLLVHRQMRDDEACARKYGADWDVYKKRVPYKIIPYLY